MDTHRIANSMEHMFMNNQILGYCVFKHIAIWEWLYLYSYFGVLRPKNYGPLGCCMLWILLNWLKCKISYGTMGLPENREYQHPMDFPLSWSGQKNGSPPNSAFTLGVEFWRILRIPKWTVTYICFAYGFAIVVCMNPYVWNQSCAICNLSINA